MKDISQNLKALLQKAGEPGVVTVDVDGVANTMKALVRQGKRPSFAKEHMIANYGEVVWEKLMQRPGRGGWQLGWATWSETKIEWEVRKALKGSG